MVDEICDGALQARDEDEKFGLEKTQEFRFCIECRAQVHGKKSDMESIGQIFRFDAPRIPWGGIFALFFNHLMERAWLTY
ncbi:hypothetical protein MPTK1_6g02420 [Marchantia polymorpha subsp. ruderalis]|uniref:Uncharacterized protein n=2 Tax=Marchantia polymorpha TaxID=3197 RepID=A0AAF6BMQ9_MARPO|nr:hypothetical protein MARPO_0035s0027 [Marchantia polymorpha]BBN13293.1 hypothetical protein Mp_6g02420 [Marchantia polymorpha subsp. ruderalis]|eukprot:PTQ41219.1 hypothetical protein MARPO_0035s0027 [Marchantia polymorpha]